MKTKTITVYRGPGYPIDPKREEKRIAEEGPKYSCVMLPGKRFKLKSEIFFVARI